MVQKKENENELKLIKNRVQEGKAIIGKDRVLKELKAKHLKKVFLAGNCPSELKEDINYYAGLVKVPVVELKQSNEELGVLCKKGYFISVLGLTEE